VVVAVTGATGILGERVVLDMGSPGHEVRQLSHRAPTETVPGVAHYSTDLTTGVGLQRALSGVQVVVDAAHSLASFRRATEVLVGARGVYRQPLRRRVSSIMSCARLWGSRMCRPPYYQAKVDQEQIGTATETYSSQRANAIVLLLEGRRTALD